ncbi:hypothetical protein ACIFOE_22440 [Paenibacillus sp. NRS-1783]|uniref:hypothetical protein n=1 Tax=unclassified Paenibacillus TaxID=185978 RepID=UPI003D2AE81E
MDNYKQFQLKNKNDFTFYLEFIITSISTKMQRFERYLSDMEEILAKAINLSHVQMILKNHSDLNTSPTIDIEIYVHTLPSEIYDSYMDMTTGAGLGIMNLLADTQKSAISYDSFRKLINKTNFSHVIEPLEKRYSRMLEHCRDFRNWSAHVPQSLINAELVLAEKRDGNAKAKLLEARSVIRVPVFEEHDTEHLVKLYMDCYMSFERFRELLLRICEDYQSLVGVETKVEFAVFNNREYEKESISDISLSMQQKKFSH